MQTRKEVFEKFDQLKGRARNGLVTRGEYNSEVAILWDELVNTGSVDNTAEYDKLVSGTVKITPSTMK